MTGKIIAPIDFYEELIVNAFDIASASTCQLLIEESPKKFRAGGSGVLIKHNENAFLISAGHVLENYKSLSIPGSDKKLYPLDGELTIQTEASKGPDIAILKLSNKLVINIESIFRIIPTQMIDLDHVQQKGLKYLAMGYPISRTWINPHAEDIKVHQFRLLTILASPEIYNKCKVDERLSYLTYYSREKVGTLRGKRIHIGVSPVGISGGGLWYMKIIRKASTIEIVPSLVGILIEFRKAHNVMLSTKIDVVTEIIRKKIDSSVPISKSVNVNIICK